MMNIIVPKEDIERLMQGDKLAIKYYESIIYETCAKCSKKFIIKKKGSKYCSNSCSTKVWVDNNLEKQRAYKREWIKEKRKQEKN